MPGSYVQKFGFVAKGRIVGKILPAGPGSYQYRYNQDDDDQFFEHRLD
jgi:hypothetical protein